MKRNLGTKGAMGYSKTVVLFLSLWGVLLMLTACGCKRAEPTDQMEDKKVVWAQYYLVRFREPHDSQISYVLVSCAISHVLTAEEFDRGYIVGMDRLVEELGKISKPCKLYVNDFQHKGRMLGNVFEDPTFILCELTNDEKEQLIILLKKNNIDRFTFE